MRAYFFVNSALSGIQKGIQVAHCVAEMARNQARGEGGFVDWADNHKTIIVLEGGFHQSLREIRFAFTMGFDYKETGTREESPFPWAAFTEDEETMNGMMTCIGIIVPERIYEDGMEALTEWETELIKLINSCPLAR